MIRRRTSPTEPTLLGSPEARTTSLSLVMRSPSARFVGPTCEVVLASDLPDLDDTRRRQVIEFVAERLTVLPGPMRLGVSVVAVLVGLVHRLVGPDAIVRLSHVGLPLVSEYFRLLRSLSYAYVWETWPTSSPTGAVA